MSEQEQAEQAGIGTFRGAAEALIRTFEVRSDGLKQMAEALENRKAGLDERAKDLDAREVKVARREAEVGQVRQIAAERKVQVEVAQAASTKANEMHKKAETELRLAKDEKTQLESVLAGLLMVKTELAALLAQAQKPAEVQA